MIYLYIAGLVDHTCSLFGEVAGLVLSAESSGSDLKAPSAMLMSLLDTLHAVLKFVSDVVRKALQVGISIQNMFCLSLFFQNNFRSDTAMASRS